MIQRQCLRPCANVLTSRANSATPMFATFDLTPHAQRQCLRPQTSGLLVTFDLIQLSPRVMAKCLDVLEKATSEEEAERQRTSTLLST